MEGHEVGNHLVERHVVVVELFESNNRAQTAACPPLLDSNPGVSRNRMLLRSFFSGTIRFSRRNSARTGAGIPCSAYSPGASIEARREQCQLVRIGHRIAGCQISPTPVPFFVRSKFPEAGVRCEFVSRNVLPARSTQPRTSTPLAPARKDQKTISAPGLLRSPPYSCPRARIFLRNSMPSLIVLSHRTSPDRPFIIWAPTSRDANSG